MSSSRGSGRMVRALVPFPQLWTFRRESYNDSRAGSPMSRVFRKVEAIGNIVNSAAHRYLRATKREDREDAFAALMACCWVACRPLYAPVDGTRSPRTDRTTDFIRRELDSIFSDFKKCNHEEIDQLALNNELKWVARHVRHRLIDAFADTKRTRGGSNARTHWATHQ